MMKKCVPLEAVPNLLPNALMNLCSKGVVRAVTYSLLDPEPYTVQRHATGFSAGFIYTALARTSEFCASTGKYCG